MIHFKKKLILSWKCETGDNLWGKTSLQLVKACIAVYLLI